MGTFHVFSWNKENLCNSTPDFCYPDDVVVVSQEITFAYSITEYIKKISLRLFPSLCSLLGEIQYSPTPDNNVYCLIANLVIHITYIYSFIWFLQDSKSTLVANEETMAVYEGQFLFSREIVIVIVMVTTPEQKYLELASYLLFEGQRRIHWTVNSTTVKIN